MTKKRSKKSKNSTSWGIDLKDERIPKIIGLISLFLGVCLAIAFLSYLTSWKLDQDKIHILTWSTVFEKDLGMNNYLGRFGAITSHVFFYWGFGLPSIVVVFLLITLGLDLIRRKSLIPFLITTRNSIAGMAFFSLLLEFLFRDSSFTWGGAFGESTCYWLSNFVGSAGLFIMLFFTILAYLMWQINPNLNDLKIATPNFTGGTLRFRDLFKAIEDTDIAGSTPASNDIKPSNTTDQRTRHSEAQPENDKPYVALRPSSQRSDSEGPIPGTDNPKEQIETPAMEFAVPEGLSSKPKRPKFDPTQLEMELAEPKDGGDSQPLDRTFGEDAPSAAPTVTKQMDVEKDSDNHKEPYDPTLDLSKFKMPTIDLLKNYEDQKVEIDRSELEANKDQIIETLLNYKIEITKIRATIGPTVTLYEIVPAPGVKISKIKNLEDDIALSLAALGIRIIAPIPGKGTIGIEVPNKKKQIVSFREVIQSDKYQNAKMDLPIALGKTISNEVFVADLAKMPHLLVAGATGQGKSVGINTILMSLLYKKHPSQVKLVLIDPKKVELFPYASLVKHYLAFLPDVEEPIITDTSKVVNTLNSLCIEMDQRYDLLKKARARNLKEYNEKFTKRRLNPNDGHKFLPYIVLVIDEFADLMMTAGKEVEMPIARLAQLARAIGIHLIIATQRPSVNIITGIIKANFPARLAFKVTSKIDSRTILDTGGADQLIGRGDMLLSIGSNVVRLQCAFVDTPEVEDVIDHIGDQTGFPEPFYLPEFTGEEDSAGGSSLSINDVDSMFAEAARLIISNQHGSTSSIQRSLQLGYNRAGRIMDQMEQFGIVGPSKGSKPRDVLFLSVEEFDHWYNEKKKMG